MQFLICAVYIWIAERIDARQQNQMKNSTNKLPDEITMEKLHLYVRPLNSMLFRFSVFFDTIDGGRAAYGIHLTHTRTIKS